MWESCHARCRRHKQNITVKSEALTCQLSLRWSVYDSNWFSNTRETITCAGGKTALESGPSPCQQLDFLRPLQCSGAPELSTLRAENHGSTFTCAKPQGSRWQSFFSSYELPRSWSSATQGMERQAQSTNVTQGPEDNAGAAYVPSAASEASALGHASARVRGCPASPCSAESGRGFADAKGPSSHEHFEISSCFWRLGRQPHWKFVRWLRGGRCQGQQWRICQRRTFRIYTIAR